ncbi:MAG: hypothetical protein H7066_18755, partial [Cytophagaceae bacterium]|nr:hypothetical protein [Gemmatimonadaceae bacterium]
MPRLLDVALPLPLFRTFSYAPGDHAPADVPNGTRVIVPFRNRREVGIVVGTREEEEGKRSYKDVLSYPDDEPAVRPALLDACQWMARHYVAPLGVALRSALPVLLTSAAAPAPPGKRQRVVVIDRLLDSLMARDEAFKRAPKQRLVYEFLEQSGGRAAVALVTEALGVTAGVVATLAKRGL